MTLKRTSTIVDGTSVVSESVGKRWVRHEEFEPEATQGRQQRIMLEEVDKTQRDIRVGRLLQSRKDQGVKYNGCRNTGTRTNEDVQ